MPEVASVRLVESALTLTPAGYRFAILELKALLATLIDAFAFAERDEGGTPIKAVPGITTRPVVAAEPERGPQLPLRISIAA